jgi:hypothetical protein
MFKNVFTFHKSVNTYYLINFSQRNNKSHTINAKFQSEKNSANDQMSIFCFQLVFQLSINPQYMTIQKYFSHPSSVI